ncbi:restriction endonuclease subunit S [Sorangium sp. So ce381]|uniref:restriction endonuclease subunit S n=1 Tax=Sorangium sp. So ce381 TaxID=3133307 RepID=UPI003F5C9592
MARTRAGWKRVKLGEIVERHVERAGDVAGYSKFVGVDHLDTQDLRLHRHGVIGVDEIPPTFRFVFRQGMVLVPTRRPRLRKCAVAPFDGLTGEKILVLKPTARSDLHPGFIEHLLASSPVQNWNIAKEVGSVTPHFRWTDMAEFEFILPPLEEQRRLAAVLQRAADVACEFRNAADIGTKTRDALIVELYQRGTRGESLTATAVGTIPRSWSVEPLGNRYSVQLGKMMSETARAGSNGGSHIPYLRNANVQWNRLELDDVATMSFTEAEREKFALRPGDILACEGRHVGKSAIWRNEIPGACYQKALHRLRAKGDDVPEFLLHCLYFLSLTGRFAALTGETTIPHLPAEKLRAMEIAFPSVGEQKEIAQAIDSFDRGFDALNKRADRAAELIRSLTVEGA